MQRKIHHRHQAVRWQAKKLPDSLQEKNNLPRETKAGGSNLFGQHNVCLRGFRRGETSKDSSIKKEKETQKPYIYIRPVE